MTNDELKFQLQDVLDSFLAQYSATLLKMTLDELTEIKKLAEMGQTDEALAKIYGAMNPDEFDTAMNAETAMMSDANKANYEKRQALSKIGGGIISAVVSVIIGAIEGL